MSNPAADALRALAEELEQRAKAHMAARRAPPPLTIEEQLKKYNVELPKNVR